jgi:putative radical SAM enzyme (TIGR03279 family)
MLGSKNGGKGLEFMRRFADAGITMNCQIVCCPGINDGEQLMKTMADLAGLYPSVNSVSIVPVGLTGHRQELYPLRPFDRSGALETVEAVEKYGGRCLERHGSRIFFCADELYIKAGRDLPEDGYYEDYPQLENGVGMMRLLMTEFAVGLAASPENGRVPFAVGTGVAAAGYIEGLIRSANDALGGVSGQVYPIRNEFFGESIDVAGLVTGRDLIAQLTGRPLNGRLLIPRNMLRHGEGVFLDDVTIPDVESALGVRGRVVEQDGGDLLDAVLGN